jgi:hypothetical protein|tara:strand:+ start:4358 stop:5299 length:942 start_codon:yes stop_codon:yes gene_type:complete
MAQTFLTLTNSVLARMNEVQLTSSTFSSARGIQVQAQNAINEAIRYVNQREFSYPFNHATNSQTLVAGTVKYTAPTSTKHIDYNTARIVKNATLGTSGVNLSSLSYNEYIANNVEQEDEIQTTTTSTTHTDSVTTITVASTSDFSAAGTLHIANEQITYTAIGSSTTFTGCTRGANSTTAASIASGVQVAQFDNGGIPTHIVRTLDNNYILYPFPNKGYTLKFDYFTFPSDLSAHGDTTTIPDRFAPTVIDGATAYAYQYRGEIEQYQLNFARFEQGIKNMQTLLVNKYEYVRSTVILKPTSMAGYFSTETTT